MAHREHLEISQKKKPRADGPVPLKSLLIFGGMTLDDSEELAYSGESFASKVPCTVIHFTNASKAPLATAAPAQGET